MALKSEGVCLYCNETVSKQEMTEHVVSHFKKMENESEEDNYEYYHISVTASEMFLVLLLEKTTTFIELDCFFRDIWVTCCMHVSYFRTENDIAITNLGNDFFAGAENYSMTVPISKIYQEELVIDYNYDISSLTHFQIQLMNKYLLPKQKEKITLISRNEPLPILCRTCNEEPAQEICVTHTGFLCGECAKKHAKECENYATMPVVNSPRMGTCKYEGGSIDLERDGYYKPKK